MKNKVVLITGGSKGIGSECVRAFAEEGYNVVFSYLSNKQKALDLKKEIEKLGVKSLCFKLDVSNNKQIEKMIYETIQNFKKIDVLINNAGITEIKPIEEIKESDWNKMININLKGAFFTSQLVFKHMKKRKKGVIINISSQAGTTGGVLVGAHYSISKAGILCLTKTLAKIVYRAPKKIHLYGESLVAYAKQSGIKSSKIIVIPTGIDFEKYSKVQDIRKEFKILPDEKIVLYAGLLIQRKGIDIVIKTLARFKNQKIKLLLVGDGPNRKEYEKLTKKLRSKT